MPEYVYGIVGRGTRPPDRLGIAAAPLRLIPATGLAALVSELGDRQPRFGRDELLVHAGVLEAALALGTVLPMRFGTVMEGADAVRANVLEAHADELRSELARLEGKVELRIRAVYEQDSLLAEIVRGDGEIARLRESLRGAPTDATYYAQIRLGELVAKAIDRRRELDAHELVEALSPVAVAVDVAQAPHERVALSASFLVDRARVPEFDAQLDRVAKVQADRMRLKYTGPLPPHSFVELAAGA